VELCRLLLAAVSSEGVKWFVLGRRVLPSRGSLFVVLTRLGLTC